LLPFFINLPFFPTHFLFFCIFVWEYRKRKHGRSQIKNTGFVDTSEQWRCSWRIIVRVAEAMTFIYTSDWASFWIVNVYWHQ
jgi:hypothetical protein